MEELCNNTAFYDIYRLGDTTTKFDQLFLQ